MPCQNLAHGTWLCIYSTHRRTNFVAFVSERREKNVFDQKKYDPHYSCKLHCHSLKVSGHTSWNGFLDSHPYSSDGDKAVHIFPSFPAHLVSVLNGWPSHITITVIFVAFIARFPMLSVRCLHLTRSLLFKYHIKHCFCIFSYRSYRTCRCISVTQCEQLICFPSLM